MPLHIASSCGHLELARYLIHKINCDPLSKTITTPLQLATLSDHVKIMNYMIVDSACFSGRVYLVKLLICEQKCDLFCASIRKLIPLHFACLKGHLELFKYLCDIYHQKC